MTSQIVHRIVDSSEWPSPVKQIAQALGQSLPAYLATGPYPSSVSTRAASLLHELSESPFLQVTREDHLQSPSNASPLADVFDIVLSTVSELRELVKCKEHGCQRPTVPLWSTLIKVMGHACSQGVSIM